MVQWKKILCYVLTVYILIMGYVTYRLYQVDVVMIPMDLQVTPFIGLNVDTDALHFGGVPKGSGAFRTIILYNRGDRPRTVLLSMQGNFTAWVTLKYTTLNLDAHSFRNDTVYVNVPQNATEGKYQGTLKIIYS